MISDKLLFSLLLIILIFTGWYVYQPGLAGGYMLDDEPTLKKLSLIDNDMSIKKLMQYFAASNTGPLKRPVSEFSFLIDGQSWPADARSFKRSNVLIHILNGAVLFIFLFHIFKVKLSDNKALLISFVAVSLWFFNPFQVSSVLYVVQRMTLLPTLFTLLALLFYFNFRKKNHSSVSQGWLLSLLLYYVLLSCAVLSKENGILLVLFLGLFEWLICRNYLQFKPLTKRQNLWFVQIPVIVFILALLIQTPASFSGYDLREFTLYERLLSEFRAISIYLYHLFIPHYLTEGVFTDGFVKSKGLFNPISTFTGLLFIVSLLVIAKLFKTKWPWATFTMLFFLLGHLLESTFIPLEMYFEHRNYLPSLFLFVPIAMLFSFLISKSKIYIPVLMVMVGIYGFTTAMKVKIWGNELVLHQMTMKQFPESERARISYASLHHTRWLKYDALKIIEDGYQYSEKLELRLAATYVRCDIEDISPEHFELLLAQFKKVPITKDGMKSFGLLFETLVNTNCGNLEYEENISKILNAFDKNTAGRNRWSKPQLAYYKGYYLVDVANDPEQASINFKVLFESHGDFYMGIQAINLMMNNRYFAESEALIDFALDSYNNEFKFRIDWQNYGDSLNSLKNNIEVINLSK